MPRPKRAVKVSATIPNSRVAKPSLAPRKKSTRSAIEDEISDGEGEIIAVPKANGRMTAVRASARKSLIMSPTGESATLLEGMEQRRDEAMARLDAAAASTETDVNTDDTAVSEADASSSPAVEIGRRATMAENSLLQPGNFSRRTRKPSILGRAPSRMRSDSVESELAEDSGLMGNVRGRQHFARSSSLGLDIGNTPGPPNSVLRTGQVKRRARAPSILGTGRKDQSRGKEIDYDEDEDEEEDDFNPEDESTPLNLSKARPASHHSSPAVSSSAVNPRKRKLSAVPARISSPLLSNDDEAASSNPVQASQSEPPQRFSTPEPLSETMAPPQSSSPEQRSPELPRQSRRAAAAPTHSNRRQPPRQVHLPPDDSPPSSPPSLTHSPNAAESAPKRQAKTKTKPLPTDFSTAQLQTLLPRRRNRGTHDPFDVESSEEEIDVTGLGSDDDELTNLSVRPNRRRPTANPHRRVARLKPGPKSKSVTQGTAEKNAVGVKKTYTRRTLSDKENDATASDDEEGDPDDSLAPVADSGEVENSQELEARVGTELKKAKRKFEDVDKWEMEFEDVTASSSSPWDAR
jgi:hypothetical protein